MKEETKFQNKYRLESARLKDWNYGNEGYYFVTICVKYKMPLFGEVVDKKMILSDIGKMAVKFWLGIPSHFSNVILDEFVVMPNHVHGIIEINKSRFGRDAINRVSTTTIENMPMIGNGGITGKHNPMGKGVLGEILRWYKGRCSFEINKQFPHHDFQWQSRFYDQIIRNDAHIFFVRQYIQQNPEKWCEDEFFI